MTKKKCGKSKIIQDVRATGLTARKAEKAVNTVFDHLKLGLWWGEPVEIPGGTLQSKIRNGKPRTRIQKFRNIQTGKIDHRIVDYPERRRVLKFTPNLNLDLTLPGPPIPEIPEHIEARQLASELLGKPVNKVVMVMLQEAVKTHPFKRETLLQRLREFKDRGERFDGVVSLARQLAHPSCL